MSERLGKYLSGIGGHAEGHQALKVAAQADAFHCDDGLLSQNGAEDTSFQRKRHFSIFLYK